MAVRPETDAFITFLNDLVEIDRAFIQALIGYRLPCNRAMADHASVQVAGDGGCFQAGFLGVINGFLGTVDDGPKAGWGPITALFADGEVTGFARTETASSV